MLDFADPPLLKVEPEKPERISIEILIIIIIATAIIIFGAFFGTLIVCKKKCCKDKRADPPIRHIQRPDKIPIIKEVTFWIINIKSYKLLRELYRKAKEKGDIHENTTFPVDIDVSTQDC